MTGKDDWRLVHIQNGMLTDSLNTKPAQPGGQSQKRPIPPRASTWASKAGLGQTLNQPGGQNTNPAMRRPLERQRGGEYDVSGQPTGGSGGTARAGSRPDGEHGNLPRSRRFRAPCRGSPARTPQACRAKWVKAG